MTTRSRVRSRLLAAISLPLPLTTSVAGTVCVSDDRSTTRVATGGASVRDGIIVAAETCRKAIHRPGKVMHSHSSERPDAIPGRFKITRGGTRFTLEGPQRLHGVGMVISGITSSPLAWAIAGNATSGIGEEKCEESG